MSREPLSNLDAKLRDTMREEIRRVQRAVGITAIFVTHDQTEALAMADCMAVMDRGRIVQIGTPVEIYRRPAHAFIASFIGQANMLQGTVSSVEGDAVRVDLGLAEPVRASADAPLERGAKVQVVIKAEAIRVERREAAGASGGVPAKVVSATFLGPTFAYVCAVGSTQFIAHRTSATETEINVGDDVALSWHPSDCRAIAVA